MHRARSICTNEVTTLGPKKSKAQWSCIKAARCGELDHDAGTVVVMQDAR